MELQWPLILFTFFVCLSAGILFMQALLSFMGKAKELQFTTLLTSGIMLVIGGIAVFLHLEHWERIFNGFGHITSGITQELIGVILMGITIIAFWLLERRDENNEAPKWMTIVAMIVPIGMVIVMAHSYNMASLPTWNTFLLEAFYLVNMVLLGSIALLIIAAARKCSDAYAVCELVAIIAAIAHLVVLAIYAFYLNGASAATYSDHGLYFDPTLPDVAVTVPAESMASLLTGNLALPYWLGSMICGGLVPVVCMLLARKASAEDHSKHLAYGVVAFLGAVVGSIAWRGILYVLALSMFAIF